VSLVAKSVGLVLEVIANRNFTFVFLLCDSLLLHHHPFTLVADITVGLNFLREPDSTSPISHSFNDMIDLSDILLGPEMVCIIGLSSPLLVLTSAVGLPLLPLGLGSAPVSAVVVTGIELD